MKNKQTIFVIGLVMLWAWMICLVSWLAYEYLRFARNQEHVSALKGIGVAFVEYDGAHQALPIESLDDLWAGGWRRKVIDSPFMKGAYGSEDAFQRILERYALLVPAESKWLDGEPLSFKDFRKHHGSPVTVVQLPKDLRGRHCSALILDAKRQRLRLRDGAEFPLTILRDTSGLRLDGSLSFIRSDAAVESILKILQQDDRF